jgi:hypothetical protein
VNAVRLSIPKPLLEKLRAIRATQLGHQHPDEVIQREEAIYLTLGLGPAIYLCFDGRVLIWHYMEDEPLRETSDLGDIATGITIGAKNAKLPELLDLLPKQPANRTACPTCDGERWSDIIPKAERSEPPRFVCWTCHGLGWVPQSTS